MCVILVCPPDVRPGIEILNACHFANPHGAGVAWREKSEVRWAKNLGPQEVAKLLPRIDGEVVIHFRWASVGGVDPKLCHPFPVDRLASTKLKGSARRVLFHNGTWGGFKAALTYLEREQERKIGGPISDSRVMALLVDHVGNPKMLKEVDGRFVLFTARETKLFGDWRQWGGMRCSNIGFVYELERANRPKFHRAETTGKSQMILWGEGGED